MEIQTWSAGLLFLEKYRLFHASVWGPDFEELALTVIYLGPSVEMDRLVNYEIRQTS